MAKLILNNLSFSMKSLYEIQWRILVTIFNICRPNVFISISKLKDRLCGLVVRVLGYRSGGPGSIPGTTRKKSSGLERGPLSLVSTTEELLDRKVVAPV
jgi:hypothetical protein